MDPASALGLTISVAQLTEAGIQVISWCRKVAKDGRTRPELEQNASALYNTTEHLRQQLGLNSQATCLTDHQQVTYDLANNCAKTAEKLLELLAHNRICESDGRVFQFFIIGFRTLCNTKEVKDLEKQLQTYKEALHTGLLASACLDMGQLRLEQRAHFKDLHSDLVSKDRYEKVLDSLYFDEIVLRQEVIQAAHRETFEWIFKDSGPESVATWLQEGDEFFWVTGHLGAGKSTLMRFIHDHPSTTSALSKWSNSRPCTQATFFFWRNGTDLQKSHTGMLRSLLYQVIKALPYTASLVGEPDQVHFPTWADQNLEKALRTIIGHDIERRYFFLIDGLDEAEDSIPTVYKFLEGLRNAGVKIIVASRPSLFLENRFASSVSLRLQDLTRGDILRFVEDSLKLAVEGLIYTELSRAQLHSLKEHIVDRAEGIFLWARLATQSCEDSLLGGERFENIIKEMDTLPLELRELYSAIVKRLSTISSKSKMQEAARYFRIANLRRIPLDVLAFTSLAQPEGNTEKWRILSTHEIRSLYVRTLLQVRQRCGGLLEVGDLRTILRASKTQITDREFFELCAGTDFELQYVHRTAQDFIKKEDVVGTYDDNHATHWNPYSALAEGIVQTYRQFFAEVEITSDMYGRYRPLDYHGTEAHDTAMKSSQERCIKYPSCDIVSALGLCFTAESTYEISHAEIVSLTSIFIRCYRRPKRCSWSEKRMFVIVSVEEFEDLSALWLLSKTVKCQLAYDDANPTRLLASAARGFSLHISPDTDVDIIYGSKYMHLVYSMWLELQAVLLDYRANPTCSFAVVQPSFHAEWAPESTPWRPESTPWRMTVCSSKLWQSWPDASHFHADHHDLFQFVVSSMLRSGKVDVNHELVLHVPKLDPNHTCEMSKHCKLEATFGDPNIPRLVCAVHDAVVKVTPLAYVRLYLPPSRNRHLQEELIEHDGKAHCVLESMMVNFELPVKFEVPMRRRQVYEGLHLGIPVEVENIKGLYATCCKDINKVMKEVLEHTQVELDAADPEQIYWDRFSEIVDEELRPKWRDYADHVSNTSPDSTGAS